MQLTMGKKFRKDFEQCCYRYSKKTSDIVCIAVTKNRDIDSIECLYNDGYRHFGENRFQEAQRKFEQWSLRKEIDLHFLGPIQSNKLKGIVNLVDCVQSVDSFDLCKKIDLAAGQYNKCMRVFFQINLDKNKKNGFVDLESCMHALAGSAELPNIRVEGVMGIASDSQEKSAICSEFRYLHESFCKLQSARGGGFLKHCSMGMSEDFQYAIREGSTMIRIGRILFESL